MPGTLITGNNQKPSRAQTMTLKRIYSALFTLALCVASLQAHATSQPPIPKSKTEALNTYQDKLKEEKENKKTLTHKAKKLDKKISQVQTEMINLGNDILDNEAHLKKIENRIIKLEIRKSVLDDQLKNDRASIAKLVLALERIRRTPPEAMLARPETPYKIAQSALLMGDIIPSINRHAEKLKKNLTTLNTVQTELEVDLESARKTGQELEKKHKSLKQLSAQNKSLFAQTNKNLKASEINIKKISLQAKDLAELVKKIKEEEKKEHERQAKAKIKKPKLKPLPKSSGKSRFPISGIIKTAYNQKDQTGSKSKGLTFEGRPGGIVTTPINGRISYTGNFKRYGNIIIIEHEGGYHSLIAGVSDITTNIGQDVKTGEPIGLLPKSTLNPHPTLYYELRKNGKPTNPSVKFSDLG